MVANKNRIFEIDWVRFAWIPQVFVWSLLAIVLVKTAWVCDDAYITFRCLENAVTGHGLCFNPGERVQAFTHPFWMLLHLPFQAIWHNPYWTTLALSFALTFATLRVLGRNWNSTIGWLVLPVMVLVSKAFVEYSTSGLENPLTHFLVVAFVVRGWKGNTGRNHLFWLSLLAGAMILNRMDTILLVGPALGFEFWKNRSWRSFGQIVLGMLPILIWEAFAVIYYGFPFPNTAYAKLGAGIPQSELWQMGLYYFQDSLQRDPVTLPVIVLGLVVGIRKRKDLAFVIGIALYLLYVARIGGDFMSGRFFTAPFLMAILIIGRYAAENWKSAFLVAGIAIFVALIGPTPVILSGITFGTQDQELEQNGGVADERAFFYPGTGMLHAFQGRNMPDFRWVQDGKELAHQRPIAFVRIAIGMVGYFAGPGKYIIDQMALADPLFARMPALYRKNYRPGHYPRMIPEGYYGSLEQDSNRVVDAAAKGLYDKLRCVTRGPIFSKERWEWIGRLNSGFHEPLDMDHLRIPIATTRPLPLLDTNAITLLFNMGVCFELPNAPRDSFALDYREGEVLNLAWLSHGKPVGAELLKSQGQFVFAIPKGVDAVAIYPDTDWPNPVIGDVHTK